MIEVWVVQMINLDLKINIVWYFLMQQYIFKSIHVLLIFQAVN